MVRAAAPLHRARSPGVPTPHARKAGPRRRPSPLRSRARPRRRRRRYASPSRALRGGRFVHDLVRGYRSARAQQGIEDPETVSTWSSRLAACADGPGRASMRGRPGAGEGSGSGRCAVGARMGTVHAVHLLALSHGTAAPGRVRSARRWTATRVRRSCTREIVRAVTPGSLQLIPASCGPLRHVEGHAASTITRARRQPSHRRTALIH